MSVGRPTKLDDSLLEKARMYLDTCTDEIHHTDKGAISYIDVSLPSIVGLARYLGVHKDTIYEWRKEKGEFSDLVSEIEQEQELRLINKGLGGLYTSKALNAMLSKHGYNEKQEIDHTTGGEKIDNSEAMRELTQKLNDVYRVSGLSSNGEPSGALDDKA